MLKLIRNCFIVCFLAGFSSSYLQAELIGYWPLDGDAVDATGNGLDGEVIGDIEFVDDVPSALGAGQSIILNKEFVEDGGGSEDEIDLARLDDDYENGHIDLGNPDVLNFSDNDWTISVWMKVPELLSQRGNLFSNGGDNGGGVRYVLGYIENGGQAIVLTTDDNADKRQAQAPAADFVVDDEEWHHIVGLREDTELRVYIDGELAGENFDVPDGYDLSGTDQLPAYIGVGADAGSGEFEKYFQGWVDDVAIWDEALSEAQIAAVMSGDFSEWLTAGILGDYNENGVLDAADLDLQTAGIGANDLAFDLNADGESNFLDRKQWIKELKKTWIGDADLNGEFNSGDLVKVFQAGLFETGQAATWEQGDFDGDGVFGSGDFVAAFQDGGFEQGPLAASTVPEPSCFALCGIGVLALLSRRRK